MKTIVVGGENMQGNFITREFIVSGGSFARDTIVDGLISESDSEVLYRLWKDEWGEPIEFQGGVKGITCEMVLQAPKTKFLSTLKAAGKRIYEAAQANAGG